MSYIKQRLEPTISGPYTIIHEKSLTFSTTEPPMHYLIYLSALKSIYYRKNPAVYSYTWDYGKGGY